MASIWLIVASSLLMALGTRGRNFAASDKPVFHGSENIHFENIKYRLRGGFICVRANSKVCLALPEIISVTQNPCSWQRAEHLRSRCSWMEVFVVLIGYFIVNAL